MSAKEVEALLDEVRELPGWRVEDIGDRWRIAPPDGPLIFHAKRVIGKGIRNLRAELRRAGWDDRPAPRERPVPVEVVDRAPSPEPGIDVLLLSDERLVSGCSDPGCARLRFDTVDEARDHRASHLPRQRREDPDPMPTPGPRPSPAAVAAANPRIGNVADALDMLNRAGALLQRVAVWLSEQAVDVERVEELERQLRDERARSTQLGETISSMQAAARVLMGQ